MSDLLFDEMDDDQPDTAATNFLVVPGCPEQPEELTRLEANYRKAGRPLIVFESEEGLFENADAFQRAMRLKRAPTLAEAEAWAARNMV